MQLMLWISRRLELLHSIAQECLLTQTKPTQSRPTEPVTGSVLCEEGTEAQGAVRTAVRNEGHGEMGLQEYQYGVISPNC